MQKSNLNDDKYLQPLGSAVNYLDEITDKIELFGLLREFNKQELTMLAAHLDCYAVNRDAYLFKKGALADHLIVIMSGEVRLEYDQGGSDHIHYGVGTTIGAEAFVEDHKWGASCMACKPTDFAVFSKASLDQVLMHSPRLGNRFLMAMMQSMMVRVRSIQKVSGKESELILS